jgi:hypothetical protein
MKKIIGLMALSLLLVSCENIYGTFDVEKAITLNSEDGMRVIRPGTYNATLKIRSKNIRVEINETQYNFSIPKNVKIPTTNGSFVLTSAQVKQPYNLFGQVETNSNYGPTYRQTEACQEQRPYTVCTPQGCYTEMRMYYGWAQVVFNIRTDVRSTFVDFRYPQNNDRAASFNAQDVSQTKVYQYRGQCL